MERDVWIKKQEELFELYFKDCDEGVNLECFVNSLVDIKEKWQSLYQILADELEDFDNHSRVMDIKEIEYMNRNYLILKFFPFDYLIIDCLSEKVLFEEEVFKVFSQEFFINNFQEEYVKNHEKVYYFLGCSDDFAKRVLNFYEHNKDVLTHDNNFYIEKRTDDNCVTSICVNLTNLEVTLGFNCFGEIGRCNYIFLDSNLEAYGVSNPDGNMNSLKKMGDRVRDISIPRNKIPNYLLSIVDNYKQKENQDEVLGRVKVLSCR